MHLNPIFYKSVLSMVSGFFFSNGIQSRFKLVYGWSIDDTLREFTLPVLPLLYLQGSEKGKGAK